VFSIGIMVTETRMPVKLHRMINHIWDIYHEGMMSSLMPPYNSLRFGTPILLPLSRSAETSTVPQFKLQQRQKFARSLF
jgi:hypothetical protein